MSRLTVTEERGPAALASLRAEWQGLFARATNASAFLAWEWISAWHSRLGQGLMPRIFCARSGDGLVGLLPLAEGPARGRVGRRVRLLSFLGERFVGGDYLDVLAEPALEHDAATAIFEHLARDQSFDALRLDGIAGDSLSLPLLTSRFGEDKAYEQSLLPYEVCPYRVLRGSGQAVIEASRRPREFRRKLRQLAALPGFATAVVTRPDEVPAALERFFMLHERRWAGQGGSDAMARPSVKAFHRDAVQKLAITGAVRFEEIWAEGRCIASLYGIDRQERFFFYQCGYDPDWAKQSVGFVRLGLSVADAADRGVKVYDFLRGSEAYKFDWADGVRSTLSVRITRRNPAGRAFLAGENLRAAAKLTAKALLPTGAVDMIRRRRRRDQRNESPVPAGPVRAPMGKAVAWDSAGDGSEARSLMDDRKSREKAFHDVEYEDDSRWQRVDKYYSIRGARVRFFDEFIAARCRDRAVLEYGCGVGGYSLQLARWGARVTAMDISETAIRRARESASAAGLSIDFRTMDAENLDFPDRAFDLICGIGILHHLQLEQSFKEVARTLKPDGDAIFMEPLGHNPLINLYRRLTPDLRTVDEHPLKLADFELARRHFDSVEVRAYHLLSLAAVPFRRFPFFPKLVNGLDRLDALLFRRLPLTRRYAWFAVAVFRRPITPGT